MQFPRESGILLHPTSLPGRYGIGDLGAEAYRFVDFLAAAGQHLWQVLPLGPVGHGSSPYQGLSAFAGNPLLISPDRLLEMKLLDRGDLEATPGFASEIVDYKAVTAFKERILARSFEIFEQRGEVRARERFEQFCVKHGAWLDDYSLFMAIRAAHGDAAWDSWGEDVRKRNREALERMALSLNHEIKRCKYEQFVFFEQWDELRRYCSQRKIRLVGDIPIFVATDSDSVWTHPEMFWLDESGRPTVVAGVPPDYFSRTGQLWNNPLYRWDVLAENGYRWWIDRFRATLALVDSIRIDHFRGFEKYWEIPAGSRTAAKGRWVSGPGADFFRKLTASLGDVPIIAEDLGTITPEVNELREEFGFPGMRVLQFAFISGRPDDVHLPHNYPRNCVVYTGTHDNETTLGWFKDERRTWATLSDEMRNKERESVLKYTGGDGRDINWDIIRLAFMSVANTAIVPLQDVLGLGNEARMNTPATVRGNWAWRFRAGALTEGVTKRLRELTDIYGR